MSHLAQRGPTFEDLVAVAPEGVPSDAVWATIQSFWPDRFAAMANCLQSPEHHAEGDVLTHTKMVVAELTSSLEWQRLPRERQVRLFWTAVLHDIGKPATTRIGDDGLLTSRGHSRTGALIARNLLWHARAPYAWREEICALIVAHQLPFWLTDREDPLRLAIETSWRCNTQDLITHATADARGRLCTDKEGILQSVAMSDLQFEEAECLGTPKAFANTHSRIEYFNRPDRDPSYASHENHTFTATLMSGLPGSGKDRWIAHEGGDQPVVSIDAIRAELGVRGTGKQGQAIQIAKEQARGYLRSKTSFIFNATNITRQMREPLLALFRDYGAYTRVVYVETGPQVLIKQNRNRVSAIPDAAIWKLADKLEPPDETEAHDVVRVVS
jgi:putative nucleotidyltransferase with HDIG domain